MAQTFRHTKESVIKEMNRRNLVPTSKVGKRVSLTIVGNGNTIDVKNKKGDFVQSIVEEGTVLQKRIFNCNANSQIAMADERYSKLRKDARAAELANDKEKAHELYQEYLNAVQFSFGILLPSSIVAQLGNNVEISAVVEQVTTDNGSLLTIDPRTIKVMQPEELEKTVFNIVDFDDDEPEEPITADSDAEKIEA